MSAGSVPTSMACISVREIITARTGVSTKSKTLWISSFSVSSKIPLAVPSRMSDLTSSSEMKLAVPVSLPPKTRSTALLERVSICTRKDVLLEMASMGSATKNAMRSE